MQRGILSVFLLTIILVAGLGVEASAQEGLAISGLSAGSSADYYQMMIDLVSGHWQKYGQLFTTLQGQWFGKLFLAVIIAIPAIFLLHYLIIGAKHFGHDGEQIYFFTLLNRIVHVFAAISFTLLVVTGLLTIFGSVFGGGTFIRTARTVHLVSAMVFVFPCFLMFIISAGCSCSVVI